MKAAVRRTGLAYWPALLGAVILLAHARWFDFVNDDAYISFRYARNLALHGQLVFNLGERVEGFTNFLWTVMLAVGIKLGVAPMVSSRFLGVFFGVATLGVVNRWSLRLDGDRPSVMHAVAPVLLATTSAFACWCTGGLETMLFTFLVTWGCERALHEHTSGRGFTSGALFALAAMTRPEGALLFALVTGFRAAASFAAERRVRPGRHEALAIVVFALLFGPYFLWRWRYFGWLFPNTFYVKSSGGSGAAAMGIYYVRRLLEDHAGVFVLFLGLGGWLWCWPRGDRARRALFGLGTIITAVMLAYTVKVGGDFMGLYRFVLPIFPLVALLIQESVRLLAARLLPAVGWVALALAGLMLAAGHVAAMAKLSRESTTFIGADRGIDTPGYLKHYADERIPVGKWLAQHARPDDLMTVGGAGVIPYYCNVPAYDVFGLVDQTIAHDPRMTISSRPGHQKWGSDEYMLSRHPTLITHIYRLHERFDGPDPLWNARGYEWVAAEIPGLAAPSYYSFLKRMDRSFGPFPARGAGLR